MNNNKIKNNLNVDLENFKSGEKRTTLKLNNSSKKYINLYSKDLLGFPLNLKMKGPIESSKKNENEVIYNDKNKEIIKD